MMTLPRRAMLPLLLAGCGLSERPFSERRQWPLTVMRPAASTARGGTKVLEVRGFRAGPGLDSRGLQTLEADGSIRTGFYEEWSVPPAQAVEDATRNWLAASNLFVAVVAPGTRAAVDLVLEGELGALWSEPAAGVAHAVVGITVVAQKGDTARIVMQRRFSETAALVGVGPQAETRAMLSALTVVLARIEADLRRGA